MYHKKWLVITVMITNIVIYIPWMASCKDCGMWDISVFTWINVWLIQNWNCFTGFSKWIPWKCHQKNSDLCWSSYIIWILCFRENRKSNVRNIHSWRILCSNINMDLIIYVMWAMCKDALLCLPFKFMCICFSHSYIHKIHQNLRSVNKELVSVLENVLLCWCAVKREWVYPGHLFQQTCHTGGPKVSFIRSHMALWEKCLY